MNEHRQNYNTIFLQSIFNQELLLSNILNNLTKFQQGNSIIYAFENAKLNFSELKQRIYRLWKSLKSISFLSY